MEFLRDLQFLEDYGDYEQVGRKLQVIKLLLGRILLSGTSALLLALKILYLCTRIVLTSVKNKNQVYSFSLAAGNYCDKFTPGNVIPQKTICLRFQLLNRSKNLLL